MNVKNIVEKKSTQKILVVVVCFIVALFSIFVVAKRATSPEFYKETIQSIDEKKATVMGVTTTAAVASTALASVIGDATTPIANEIMDMSSYLLIVVFALVLATVIPFSLKISDLIYESNMNTVEDLNAKVEGIDGGDKEEQESNKSWWGNLVDKVEEGASKVADTAKQLLNNFIDVIALFVITYCAVPIIVFMVMIWFIRILFNISIPIPSKEKLRIFHKKNLTTEVGVQKEEA